MIFSKLPESVLSSSKPKFSLQTYADTFLTILGSVQTVSSTFLAYSQQLKDDADNATRLYFKQKFERLNRSKDKEIYCHYTTAVDTKALRVVMASVRELL